MADPVVLKTAAQATSDMLSRLYASTNITDENVSAATVQSYRAIGEELFIFYLYLYQAERARYWRTATGLALSNYAANYGINKKAAVAATAIVRFTGTPATSIPAGTLVSAPATAARDKVQFSTPSVGSYTVGGGGTVDVPCTALVTGADGNVGAGLITDLETAISGITSITNPAAAVMGADEERDEALRERLRRHLDSLSKGTIPALLDAALSFEQIELTLYSAMDASQTTLEVHEDLTTIPLSEVGTGKLWLSGVEVVHYTGIDTSVTPNQITGLTRGQESTTATTHETGGSVKEYIPTGQGVSVASTSLIETPGNVQMYVDDGTASGAHSELVDLVQKRLRGDGTARDPGYKSAGITLSVSAYTIVSVAVTATVVVDTSRYATATAIAAVQTAVENYLNTYPGDENTVRGSAIHCVIMDVPGVLDVSLLTIQGNTFDNTGASDVGLTTAQMARAGTATIS